MKIQLPDSNASYLLAISGGADSVCLAHILKEMGVNFAFAHVNYHLRGPESNGDEQFVLEFAKRLNIQVHKLDASIADGINIQDEARKIRYTWFESLMNDFGFQYIITAHHANDNAETIIHNFVKGTSNKGLRGIKNENNYLIRPLLQLSKTEILQYLTDHKLKYREDSSNTSLKYTRNFIRNKVIPQLEKINPNISQTINNYAILHQETDEFVTKQIISLSHDCIVRSANEYKINFVQLASKAPLLLAFSVLFQEYGFSLNNLKKLVSLTTSESGKTFRAKNYLVTRAYDELIVQELHVDETEEESPIGVEFDTISTLHDSKELDVRVVTSKPKVLDPHMAYLDLDKLEFPLNLSKPTQGLKFKPLGMKGYKLISAYLKDVKMPNYQRNKCLVLLNGNGDVLWLVGQRQDDRYKITEETKNFLLIAWRS